MSKYDDVDVNADLEKGNADMVTCISVWIIHRVALYKPAGRFPQRGQAHSYQGARDRQTAQPWHADLGCLSRDLLANHLL